MERYQITSAVFGNKIYYHKKNLMYLNLSEESRLFWGKEKTSFYAFLEILGQCSEV